MRQLVDEEIRRRQGSKAPDNSSGRAVIVLIGAGVVAVHVIALHPPGKILEAKLVVGATANVDRDGVIDEAVGVHVTNATHGVHEGAPFSIAEGKAWAGHEVILRDSSAVETAAIEHQSDARKAGKRERFKRTVPAAIALFVDHVGELTVGHSGVDVSIGQESVKLRRHGDGKQKERHKCQRRGSRL